MRTKVKTLQDNRLDANGFVKTLKANKKPHPYFSGGPVEILGTDGG